MHALDENVDPPGGLTKLEFDETNKFILFLDGQFPTQTVNTFLKVNILDHNCNNYLFRSLSTV